MSIGFVLINAELGSEDELLDTLRSSEAVGEAYATAGIYDIIVKVHGESTEKVKETVIKKIRRLNGVRSTVTVLVTEQTPNI